MKCGLMLIALAFLLSVPLSVTAQEASQQQTPATPAKDSEQEKQIKKKSSRSGCWVFHNSRSRIEATRRL